MAIPPSAPGRVLSQESAHSPAIRADSGLRQDSSSGVRELGAWGWGLLTSTPARPVWQREVGDKQGTR